MSAPQPASAQVDPDDWDHHWESYGEAAEGNPANLYRRQLILKLLGPLPDGATVLDIGSGQGEFAVHLQGMFPKVTVWGVEYSAAGVQRSQAAAAEAGVGARFTQRDLLSPVKPDPDQPLATHALCSEVLEHVEDPTLLLHNSLALLAPGARVVITVPGGPRSAFDKHIGHHQHFNAKRLSKVITDSGLTVDRVLRAGFPSFNLYKLAVIARGERLVADVKNRRPEAPASGLETAVTKFFDTAFKVNVDDAPLGWQMAAVAHVPAVI